MIKNNKGFGIIQSILLCGFLVFLVIPAFSVITEKVYLKFSVHRINELADAAIMSSVFSIDTPAFSGGDLVFGSDEKLESGVFEMLCLNKFENMEILEFYVTSHKAGSNCPQGDYSQYDFIHLMMKVSLERYGSDKTVEFYIHRDLEFPYDR